MKKKVFFQISTILYILLAFFLTILGGCFYIVIWFFIDMIQTATAWEWLCVIAAIFGIIFVGFTFIRFAKNRIILDSQEIYVPEHWGGKNYKLQYETHIDYTEIKDIFFVLSNNNSLNKSLRWGTLPMPYIVFECNDGTRKNVNAFYYSKRQVVKIIDETKLRAKMFGNELPILTGTEILEEFLKNKKSSKTKKD